MDARLRGVVSRATTKLLRTTPNEQDTQYVFTYFMWLAHARSSVGAALVVKSARHARAPVHVTRTVAPTSLPK